MKLKALQRGFKRSGEELHNRNDAKASTLPVHYRVLAFGMPLLIIFAVFFTIWQQTPPEIGDSEANFGSFSSKRALDHLSVIAESPRAIRSQGHVKAEEYITRTLDATGISFDVQDTTGSTRNIIGRLSGTDSTGTILVTGHYDTVSNSPGAGDDGCAIVVMLETLRTLRAGPPLKNDLVFLFSDGEETGLLGAKAFLYGSDLARNIGLVLNFDARGSCGPVLMFETSRNNGWLIEEFSKSAHHPFANSFMYEVYKLLPNNTDFSVFKEADIPGLNFAFIDGYSSYHKSEDSIENLDLATLHQEGVLALELTRHFGALDLHRDRSGDSVYFDLLGQTLINYPMFWVAWLTLFLFLVLLIFSIAGIKNGRLCVRGIARGCATSLIMMVTGGVVASVAQGLIARPRGPVRSNNDAIVLLAVCLLTGLISCSFLIKRMSVPNLVIGGLVCWSIFLLFASIFSPGASYLFSWPLLFGVIASFPFLFAGASGEITVTRMLLLLVPALCGVALLGPVTYILLVGLRFEWPVSAMIAVFPLTFLTPHMQIVFKCFSPSFGMVHGTNQPFHLRGDFTPKARTAFFKESQLTEDNHVEDKKIL